MLGKAVEWGLMVSLSWHRAIFHQFATYYKTKSVSLFKIQMHLLIKIVFQFFDQRFDGKAKVILADIRLYSYEAEYKYTAFALNRKENCWHLG